MLFNNYLLLRFYWILVDLSLLFIEVEQLQIVLRLTQILNVLTFFKKKFCLMPGLNIVSTGQFVRDYRNFIFRSDFTHFSGALIVDSQRMNAGWYNFKYITFYINQVFQYHNRLIAIILNFDLFKLLQKTDKINNVTKPRKASVRDKIQQKITKLAANIIDSHNKNVIKITLQVHFFEQRSLKIIIFL